MTLMTGQQPSDQVTAGTTEPSEQSFSIMDVDPGAGDSLKVAKKEEEIQLLLGEVKTLAENLNPETHDMRRKLLDPAINALFVLMKKELGKKEAKIKQLTEELEAVNFTPSSLTGKRLLAKCRSLQHENEELGKRLCQGRVAQYELEIAMQKKLIDELKGNIKESDQLIVNLDEEVETLQSRVFNLQAHVDYCEKNHPAITSIESDPLDNTMLEE
ncbi:hypothetical protein K493DRAFT_407164 [Basidiobolus meristosporus CBS 931.73]|uniref:Uncharacterized protein n=1 Tax=Basidiobolus meristosporus CBS 931.73 TaxID=1314790 RepID=A0A1Y1YFB4_9FUNG|nr:hypothetical protein K493DRAFT_407164 [Basidiobolus meristosporus CBS 931.73]|eukprot:ORX96665.1 hypothetical protein K493DRAFT_407164 [Basidiobolus meristosporus CBS 931.73]